MAHECRKINFTLVNRIGMTAISVRRDGTMADARTWRRDTLSLPSSFRTKASKNAINGPIGGESCRSIKAKIKVVFSPFASTSNSNSNIWVRNRFRFWPEWSGGALMRSIYRHRRFSIFDSSFQFPSMWCLHFINTVWPVAGRNCSVTCIATDDDIQFETVVFKHENILTRWLDFYLELSFISIVLYFSLRVFGCFFFTL